MGGGGGVGGGGGGVAVRGEREVDLRMFEGGGDFFGNFFAYFTAYIRKFTCKGLQFYILVFTTSYLAQSSPKKAF